MLPVFASVEIDVVDMDVMLIPANYNGIEMRYDNRRDIEWAVTGGTLRVRDKTNSAGGSWFLGFGWFTHTEGEYVKVYFADGELDGVFIETVSGGVEAGGFGAGAVTVSAVSGGITLKNVGADDIRLQTVSGEVDAYGCAAARLSCETVSGGMELTRLSAEDIRFESVSGNLHCEIDGRADMYEITFSTLSGRAKLNGTVTGRNYTAWGINAPGGWAVDAPPGSGTSASSQPAYRLSAESVSGNIEIRFSER
jgi:DUF4097 and DUF4098 domain-containing protein YvlB